MKNFFLVFIVILFFGSVQAGWGPELCEDVACSGHGYCEEDGSDEWCVCDSGYIAEGLNCVLGCDGETCSSHGTCSVSGGVEVCTCEPGFHSVGLQCILDEASTVDTLSIINEDDCYNTGNCHYRLIFATNYYSFTPENASLYEIIINVKDPENNWYNYWKTVAQCSSESVCDNLDAQYVDFWWQHEIGGNQYIAVEITGNGDDAYDHLYHTVSTCLNTDCDGHGTCADIGGTAVCSCENGFHNPVGDLSSCVEGFSINPTGPTTIDFEGISLLIPEGAASVGDVIKIDLINKDDLPVSEETTSVFYNSDIYAGYKINVNDDPEFIFNEEITISIKYDKAKVVDLNSDKENVFVYSFVNNTWKPLKRFTNFGRSGVISVKSDTAGTYSVQTLNIQNNPPKAQGINTVPQGIEEVNPMKGIKEINPPTPNRTGSAEISIPIEVPEGVNGLTPQLSIDYSSDDRKMGNCGFGWNLKTSSIEIKTKNKGIPKYDGTDTYMLDGEELVHVGTENGNEIYRLMKESSFLRIEKIALDGIEYFVVKTPDGIQKRYGYDRNARLSEESTSDKKIFRWYIDKTEDKYNNKIKYNYSSTIDISGDVYTSRGILLLEIKYGYNDNLSIQLEWDSMPDQRKIINSMPGFLTGYWSMLSSINIKRGLSDQQEEVRKYSLSYLIDELGINSLLDKIDEENYGELTNSSNFEYEGLKSVDNNGIIEPLFFNNIMANFSQTLVNIYSANTIPHNGNSAAEFESDALEFSISLSEEDVSSNSFYGSKEWVQIGFFDINGDGIPDRVAKKNEYVDPDDPAVEGFGEYYVLINRGYDYDNYENLTASQKVTLPGLASGQPYFKAIQWNSQSISGLDDVIDDSVTFGYSRVQGGFLKYGSSGSKMKTVDLNGDELPDRIGVVGSDEEAQVFVQYNSGHGYNDWVEIQRDILPEGVGDRFYLEKYYLTKRNVDGFAEFGVTELMDMNGDGKIDRIFFDKDNMKMFAQISDICEKADGSKTLCFKNDSNKDVEGYDGVLSDVFGLNESFSRNSGVYSCVEDTGCAYLFPRSIKYADMIDMDGDGLEDIFIRYKYDDQDNFFEDILNLFFDDPGDVDELEVYLRHDINKFSNVNWRGDKDFAAIEANIYTYQYFFPELEDLGPRYIFSTEYKFEKKILTADINNDGLPDLIKQLDQGTELFFNTGNGFKSFGVISLPSKLDEDQSISTIKSVDSSGFWGNPGYQQYVSKTKNISNIVWADFNGDGFVDIINKNGDSYTVYQNQLTKINLLKRISNNITGKKTDIEYKNLYINQEARAEYDNGFYEEYQSLITNYRKKLCMTETVVSNEASIFPVNILNSYDYFDGYYDRVEKEFRGFKKVESKSCPFVEESGVKTCVSSKKVAIQEYDFVNLLQFNEDLTVKKDVYGINDLFDQYLYKQMTALETGIEPPTSSQNYKTVSRKEYSYNIEEIVPLNGETPAVKLPYLNSQSENIYDESGISIGEKLTDFAAVFSSDGALNKRIVETTETNYNDPNISSDDFKIKTEFYFDSANWIYKESNTTKTSISDSFISSQAYVYDNLGSLVSKKEYKSISDFYQTDFTYDSYGNVASIYTPDGLTSEIVTTIIGGDVYYKKMITPAHPYGSASSVLPSEKEYDCWGNIVKNTQLYIGNSSDYEKYEYDEYNRIKKIIKTIDGVEKEIKYVGYAEYEEAGKKFFASTAYYYDSIISATSGMQISSIYDASGKKYQTKRKIDNAGVFKWLVSGNIERDAHGRVIKQGRPYSIEFLPSGPIIQTGPILNATTFSYDERGRLVQISSPEYSDGVDIVPEYTVQLSYETMKIFEYDFHAGGINFGNKIVRKVNKSDSIGRESVEYKDINDATIRTAGKNENGNYNVKRFNRDIFGNEWIIEQELSDSDIVTGVTADSSNIPGSKSFDALGRIICLGSPDTGITYYHYNDEGLIDVKSECGKNYEKSFCSDGAPIYHGGGENRLEIRECRNTHYDYDELKRLEYIIRPGEYSDPYDYYGASNRTESLEFDTSERIVYYAANDSNKYNQNQIKWILRGNYSAVGFNFGEFSSEETRYILSTGSRTNFVSLDDNNTIFNFLSEEFASSTFVYDYDVFGRIIRMEYPDGEDVEYEYNEDGTLHRIFHDNLLSDDYIYAQYEYNDMGQRSKITQGNGNVIEYNYYPENGMLDTLVKKNSESGGITQISFKYRYYPDGNVKTIADSSADYVVMNRSSQVYGYDLNGRIAEGVGTLMNEMLYDQGFSFDDADRIKNRLFYKRRIYDQFWNDPSIPSTMGYIYNDPDHAVDSIHISTPSNTSARVDFYYNDYGGVIFEYLYNDVNASAEEWIFGRAMVYDQSNRMKYLSDWRYKEFLQDHSPDSLIQYKYDHQGKRIRKWGIYGCDEQSGCLQQSITTLKTFYHGDYFETYGDGFISYKHISDGKDVITTVADISDILCDSCDPSNYYYTQNHIGSTVQLANDQGNVVEHMIYDPFGRTAYHWKSDETGQNGFAPGILFTGQKFDGDTGLYYFKARYYDPTIGVFTRPDPSLDGLNHYVYANANPIKYVDPSGMVTYTNEYNDQTNATYKWIVEEGDTINSISKQTGIKKEDLLKSNPDVGENASLVAGGTISIPQIERIVAFQWATEQIGSKNYAYNSQIDNFKTETHKCNKFVSDAYEKGAGVDFPKHKALGFVEINSPVTANELANKKTEKVGDFKIIANPKIGDIVAFGRMGTSGHLTIFGLKNTYIGASANEVTIRSENYMLLGGYKDGTARTFYNIEKKQ